MNTKKTLLLLLCGILVFCFAACNQTQPDMTEAPTNTTNTTTNPVEETTQATEPEETTEVTEPEETEPEETTAPIINSLSEYPAEGRKLSEEEMKPFVKLVKYPDEETPVWYNVAVTCLYNNPRNIDLGNLFYVMSGEDRDLTYAEMKFLDVETKNPADSGLTIIHESTVDNILQQYYGITLDACYKRGLSVDFYQEDTGYYYLRKYDTNSNRGLPTVEAIYQRDGGFYDIYYTSRDSVYDLFRTEVGLPMDVYEKNNVLGFCLTLKETDTNYQVISNIRLWKQEPGINEPDITEFFTPQGTRLTEEEMDPFKAMIEFGTGGVRWYNLATTHIFDRPEAVNIDYLLCAMPRHHTGLTAAEEEFLSHTSLSTSLPSYIKEHHGGGYVEFGVYEYDTIDGVLQEYFGITMKESYKNGIGRSIYWDDTDCYYRARNDTESSTPAIKAIYRRKGVHIYYDIYYTSEPYGFMYSQRGEILPKETLENILCYCLELKETDDGYLILSNTPIYRPEEPKEEVWTPQ